MNRKAERLARKYARAFLNLYINKLTQNQYEAFLNVHDILVQQKKVLFFLGLAMIPDELKHQALEKLFIPFDCGAQFHRLVLLLLESQRIHLLPLVLNGIIQGYREAHGIVHVFAATSHTLTDTQVQALGAFFKELLNAQRAAHTRQVTTVQFETKVTPQLIAGLKVQGDNFLWEYSIDKQLREIEQLLSSKGYSWK